MFALCSTTLNLDDFNNTNSNLFMMNIGRCIMKCRILYLQTKNGNVGPVGVVSWHERTSTSIVQMGGAISVVISCYINSTTTRELNLQHGHDRYGWVLVQSDYDEYRVLTPPRPQCPKLKFLSVRCWLCAQLSMFFFLFVIAVVLSWRCIYSACAIWLSVHQAPEALGIERVHLEIWVLCFWPSLSKGLCSLSIVWKPHGNFKMKL